MFKTKVLAAALAGAGLLASTAFGDSTPATRKIDPALLLGIDPQLCSGITAGAPDRKLFYKVAAATTELKPYGQLPATEQAPSQALPGDQPLWNNLGSHSYRITTASPLAQRYFNQGLRLAYGFNHAEAARAFRTAQKHDPACAMCYWGEALVLGPNINMPMVPEAVAPAVAASRKAADLAQPATPREQALIKAMTLRYSADPKADRKALDTAWANAMREVTARFPDDQDIAVLYAESLMNLSPWDYWEAGGARPKGRTAELVATLEGVLKTNPDHPGAIHYYIHTVEASTEPKRAEPYADRLGALMPGAGHIVHMPAHIYFRVGRYQDSLQVNRQAVAVDEAYIAEQKPEGIYPLGYYPHNVHFVLVSAQMAGDGKTAVDAAEKLSRIVTDDAARAFPLAQPVKVAPYFAHAQFSQPETILALPKPGTGLPYVEGIWHYARGVAFAARGDTESARRESNEIVRVRRTADLTGLTEGGIPADEVLRIANHVVDGRIAQAGKDLAGAAAHFRMAVALEDQLAYMEPAYWYYPVRQSLGAVLLQMGDTEGAEQAFRDSLYRVPNNGWALYGLAETYRQRGDAKRAAAAEELLAKAWAGNRDQLSLEGM